MVRDDYSPNNKKIDLNALEAERIRKLREGSTEEELNKVAAGLQGEVEVIKDHNMVEAPESLDKKTAETQAAETQKTMQPQLSAEELKKTRMREAVSAYLPQPSFFDFLGYFFVDKIGLKDSAIYERKLIKLGLFSPSTTDFYHFSVSELRKLQTTLCETLQPTLKSFGVIMDYKFEGLNSEDVYKSIVLLYSLGSTDIKKKPREFIEKYLKINNSKDHKTQRCIEQILTNPKNLPLKLAINPFINKETIIKYDPKAKKGMLLSELPTLKELVESTVAVKKKKYVPTESVADDVLRSWDLSRDEKLRVHDFAYPSVRDYVESLKYKLDPKTTTEKVARWKEAYASAGNYHQTKNYTYLLKLHARTHMRNDEKKKIQEMEETKNIEMIEKVDKNKADFMRGMAEKRRKERDADEKKEVDEIEADMVRKTYAGIMTFKEDLALYIAKMLPTKGIHSREIEEDTLKDELQKNIRPFEKKFQAWNQKRVPSMNSYNPKFYDLNMPEVMSSLKELADFYFDILSHLQSDKFSLPDNSIDNYNVSESYREEICFLTGAISELNPKLIDTFCKRGEKEAVNRKEIEAKIKRYSLLSADLIDTHGENGQGSR